MRRLFMVIGEAIICLSSFGQTISLSGSVRSQDEKKNVQHAVIALLTPKDSILYSFTRTDASGNFTIKNITPGKYILMVTHPYYADLLEPLKIYRDTSLSAVNVYSKSKLLQEVIIKSGSPFHIKGDTTVYTADSFKVSANANVEELLKKLPGIQVDKDGKITAMGETVQTVLVDGEEFFGSDPGMAIKNIRADAVKEVQVFDKKSDQAEFTGIDDGKTQKTINLKLKDNAKHGYFGKIDASAGTVQHNQNRYNENLMFSSFRGERKISGYLLGGNTGQDGLSWQDEQKYGAGASNLDVNVDDQGNLSVNWIGSNDNEPYVDPLNGYMTNENAGLFYSNKWHDKNKVNLSPTFQNQKYINDVQTFTQSQVGDSILYGDAMENDQVNRHNFKTRAIFDVKLDSANSLKISSNVNFYHTESQKTINSITTGGGNSLKNSSISNYNMVSDKQAESGNLLFRHKFAKARRTISFTGNWQLINNNNDNYLKSENNAYNQGQPSGSQALNQHKTYQSRSNNLNAQVAYTEPLSKRYSLELAYQLAYNYGLNNQVAYSFTPSTSKYDFLVDSLSNNFKQNIVQQVPSTRINYAGKKIKMNLGAGFGFTSFDLKDNTLNKDYLRHYTNFYPSALITYTYKPNRSIRFSYNGRTTQPTVNQLQPLVNNNNYFSQVIGNPNLKPSFSNSFQISANSYNFLTGLYSYLFANGNFTSNDITMSQVINLDSGTVITQPVNVNGNYNFSLYSGAGYMVKKIQTRFNFSPNLNFSRYAQIINHQQTYSRNMGMGLYIGASIDKQKKYDFSINDNFNYNINRLPQQNTRIHYNTNELSLNGTVYFHKVWSLNSDLQSLNRQKTFAGEHNLQNNIWNARFQRTLHHDEFTIYLSVHDILNQNIGIDRSFTGNTYTQTTNDRLKRYFMIGFQWDFKNQASKPKSN